MAKRSSDPPGSLPRSQTSGTGHSASCGYCCTLCPTGGRCPGKFVLSSPREKMGTGDLCRVPPAAVRHGRARQTSGTGPCGDCRRVLWVPGPRGQYWGKIRFIEKPGVQDEGGRHMFKRSSDPRAAYPEVKLQVRDPVRVVSIVAPFAPLGAGTWGKFVLSSAREKMGTGALRRVPPAAVRHGAASPTSGTEPCGDC